MATMLDSRRLCSLIMKKHSLSLRGFARLVGVSPPTAADWLSGRSVPTDSHGLTLAALSGYPTEAVLLALAYSRTDCPEGRAAWRRLFVENGGETGLTD